MVIDYRLKKLEKAKQEINKINLLKPNAGSPRYETNLISYV
jgi:hypothetical protein